MSEVDVVQLTEDEAALALSYMPTVPVSDLGKATVAKLRVLAGDDD